MGASVIDRRWCSGSTGRRGPKRSCIFGEAIHGSRCASVTAQCPTARLIPMFTYVQCVEEILGSAETFFTSVFAAQGRRQLSAYKNAEIKTLLADLLGLDEIRALGAKASETAKLLKAGLLTVRQECTGLKAEVE